MVYATTVPEFKKTLRKILRLKSDATNTTQTGAKTATDLSTNKTNLTTSNIR